MTGTVAGVDSSTQSVTVEVRDLDDGTLVSRARHPHPVTTPPRSEVDPDAWWAALETLLRGPATTVDALSVAAQQHGMVVLGADDRPLRPANLWNDTDSAPQAAVLVDRLGASVWAQRCGSVPVAALTISKLAWLAGHEPDAHARIRRVLLPHDWLTLRLTGDAVTDRGDASGTGYWSADGGWQTDLLELVGLDVAVCPEVLGPVEAAGHWNQAVVGPGTGDNMAAALGLGLRPGDVAVSIGTSGVVSAVAATATADATGAVSGFADATGRFLPLVCTLNATKVTDAVARLLGVGHEELSELALAAPSGAGGTVLVPYFDGERTPNLPDATGTIVGLRTDISRESLARAAFEGVVCGLVDALDTLGTAGVPTSAGRLLVVGGGARSAAYPYLLASLTGRAVTVVDEPDQVAAGACVQAAAVCTGAAPLEVAEVWARGSGQVIEPDPSVDAAAVRAAFREAASARQGRPR
jgi:xylulokinase